MRRAAPLPSSSSKGLGLLLLLLVSASCEAGPEARRARTPLKKAAGRDGLAKGSSVNATELSRKQARLFPVFNIVTFANAPCSSTIASSGTSTTNRNGTCLTSTTCQDRGGTIGGNCAAGFGVCCVFIISATSGGTITQNCTYIQNNGFPSALADTAQISYTINKCSNDVCDVRLDFETFNTVAVGSSMETTGGTCTDMLTFTTSGSGQNYPTICGANTGQHVYLNLGNQDTDAATLNFAFSGTSTNRMFDIKVTQVECTSRSRSPDGCLQYHEGTTGRIETFNFTPTSGESHLASQEYSVCIRPEEGFCCVQYAECANTANAFSLDNTQTGGNSESLIDSQCTDDFIVIGEGQLCGSAGDTGAVFTSRFCGPIFNLQNARTVSIPICDCNAPFSVCIETDATADTTTLPSRGTCLEFTQLPCTA